MVDNRNRHLERVLRECAESGVPDTVAPWDAIRKRVGAQGAGEPQTSGQDTGEDRATDGPRARRPRLVPDHPFAWVLAVLSVLILGLGAYTASGLVRELVDNGMPGPASSEKKISGTSGNDQIVGSRHDDTIYALGGNDMVFDPNGGNNVAFGGEGNDWLGLVGPLYGGPGEDTLEPEGGSKVSGGPGADLVIAHNDERDSISCGAGRDIVYFDKGLEEPAADCEKRKDHEFKLSGNEPFSDF